MDASLKKILRGISLELRHELEGWHDKKTGVWNPGDLERRLNEIGVWSDRPSKPLDEMPHLSAEDKAARRLVDGYLQLRAEAGVERAAAVAEFVRESAYTWANRLFALRCMEARSIIEEVILQKAAYAGRSLVHQRYLRKNPDAAKGEDDGLFAVLFAEFVVRSQELPALFDPKSPAVALRPSVAALKRCVALLSGTDAVRGQDPATDEVFAAPDAFGWAYQYWNADEKERVLEMVRTKKEAKIQGADIIPATQLYTEPYMVKFLVQNSLGALWMSMYPDSKLYEPWEYYVKDNDRVPVARKPILEITLLDPAQGSGHFHLEAFDLFYTMYEEEAAREGRVLTPREIAAAILNHNLFGIDIDGRSVQIATAALWMKAKERAPDMEAGDLMSFHDHLVATNIRLPKGKNHLELFLQKHPEDKDLAPALEMVFQGLEHADELGSLLQIEELVDAKLRRLKEEADKSKGTAVQTGLFEPTLLQTTLAVSVEDYDQWKRGALNRLKAHFEKEAQVADPVQSFFGESAGKGLAFFDVLSRRYDLVTANPPYMGSRNMGTVLKKYVDGTFLSGKRDLYTSFILRCTEFLKEGSRAGFVTLHTFMTGRVFSDFRKAFHTTSSIEVFAHLGKGTMKSLSNPNAQGFCMFVFVKTRTSEGCGAMGYFFRLVDCDSKELMLAETLRGRHPQRVYRRNSASFSRLAESQIIYWAGESVLDLLGSKNVLAGSGYVPKGLTTGDNARFLRFGWEVHVGERWFAYAKGGGYRKWHGLQYYCVDWYRGGARLKNFVDKNGNLRSVVRNERFYLQPGFTYTEMANSSLGVRVLDENEIFDARSPGIFSHSGEKTALMGILNSRISTFCFRCLSPGVMFDQAYAPSLPLPCEFNSAELKKLVLLVVDLKRLNSSATLTERAFDPYQQQKLCAITQCALDAILLAAEGEIEKLVLAAYPVSAEDKKHILEETGCPTAWFSFLKDHDFFPLLSAGLLDYQVEISTSPETTDRQTLTQEQLGETKKRLRRLYEGGSGAAELVEVPDSEETEIADEEPLAVGAYLPIPPETFVEDLSRRLEIHPISIYWLLKDGIEHEGWRCVPEERRIIEDRFTVLVMRLLGHRWPKQLEAGELLPAWADQNGVIPLTSGGGEIPLIERIRERLAEDFPGSNVAALEREFEEIVGSPLEQWLTSPFYERHISQFKKRPIAWQLETVASRQASGAGDKGKKKRGVAGKPVFACLVYYHKLDVDLLPKIRTQYVGILRDGFETEFRTLERLANPTGDQQARRALLEQWTDELQAFDRLLEDVSLRGFGPDALRPALRQYGINDALLSLTACWLRRFSETVAKGPLSDWMEAATKTELHSELPKWLKDSLSNLNHFCAVLGPKSPDEKSFATDPTSKNLAPLVCNQAKSMVENSLELGCDRWRKPLDAAVLEPLRQEIKIAKEEIEKIDEELKTEGLPFQRRNELGERKHELKVKIKSIKSDHDEKSDRARKVRSQIEKWTCPEAETWETWLSSQPLFDAVASLDGQRPPPQSIADFITQESRYAPDINDGVRVNIAPIQKAGLLHADVLDPKDADKAIADRAEWRADERRWVREGKLPHPGWWATEETETHS